MTARNNGQDPVAGSASAAAGAPDDESGPSSGAHYLAGGPSPLPLPGTTPGDDAGYVATTSPGVTIDPNDPAAVGAAWAELAAELETLTATGPLVAAALRRMASLAARARDALPAEGAGDATEVVDRLRRGAGFASAAFVRAAVAHSHAVAEAADVTQLVADLGAVLEGGGRGG